MFLKDIISWVSTLLLASLAWQNVQYKTTFFKEGDKNSWVHDPQNQTLNPSPTPKILFYSICIA